MSKDSDKNGQSNDSPKVGASPEVNPSTAPDWLLPASVKVFVGTLVFMMVLVLLSTMKIQVPESSRFLVVVVLALGAGFGAAGMTGSAVVNGSIPFPGAASHPVAFSFTGGLAVFLIVILLRDQILPASSLQRHVELYGLAGLEAGEPSSRTVITARYAGFSIGATERAYLALCRDAGCSQEVRREQIDQPTIGSMVVFLSNPRAEVQAGRLIVQTLAGEVVSTSDSRAITW